MFFVLTLSVTIPSSYPTPAFGYDDGIIVTCTSTTDVIFDNLVNYEFRPLCMHHSLQQDILCNEYRFFSVFSKDVTHVYSVARGAGPNQGKRHFIWNIGGSDYF